MVARLDEKVAAVTGAGSGFGRAIALRLADEGARIVVADRDEEGGAATVDLVTQKGGLAELVVADVSTSDGAASTVERALSAYGGIDVLVNNAGIAPPEPSDSWNAPEESWNRVLQINLTSAFLCSQAAIPHMIERGRGSIVNISSIAATRACSGASYAAAKAGMIGYAKQVAPELATRGVRVNCVSPGFMRTPMSTGERWGLDVDAQEAQLAKMGEGVPMQKVGTADDIAAAVAYLASDDAAYVTGQEIVVDGGFLCASASPQEWAEGNQLPRAR